MLSLESLLCPIQGILSDWTGLDWTQWTVAGRSTAYSAAFWDGQAQRRPRCQWAHTSAAFHYRAWQGSPWNHCCDMPVSSTYPSISKPCHL